MKKKKGYRIMFYFLFGILLLLIYFVGCHADFIAGKLAFHPPKYPKGRWELWNKVDDVSMEVSFRNSKNQMLVGRYFEYQKIQQKIDDHSSHSDSPDNTTQGSILYCHGNGENVSYLVDLALQLSCDLRCNVLIFDYAGYGKSEGKPTAKGILDDGHSARNWLAAHDGILREQVIVYGQSLGGSVAVDIAAKDGARGLIVESSFTSLGDMGRELFPILPVNYLLREHLASVEKIDKVTCPVFISHSKSDNVIPFSQGQRLFDIAKEPKMFYIPPSGYDYHSAPHCKEHREKLKEFINSIPNNSLLY
ncbi:MAG: alpha/beta hydrolase [Planctomycetaceae bacterium]|jgi:pimeloyl-ACP methyl ester carboxylesterase|nr:alpha/beta hydrolase [Planctomycetaceae bacterium]